ncbi:MAG TPA: phosphatase PAP2 family protein [Pirellulales bacterium]
MVERWWLPVACAMLAGHFVLATALTGFNPEFLAVDGLGLTLVLASRATRRFALLVFPFWLAGIAYDNLLPLVLPFRGPIHIDDLYFAELHWFGIGSGTGRETLCQFFARNHWPAIDLLCGFAYACYLPEMIPFAVYLFFKDRRVLGRLAWLFCLVHLANFVTYIIYPAAPPWYVELYGLGPAVENAKSYAAGFGRVDEILGVSVVNWFYSHNVNVFGAMPSGHVGSAVLFALVARDIGPRWFAGASIFAGLMAFGAVYFRQHYVLDVIAGCAYATIGYCVVTSVESWILGSPACVFAPTPVNLGEARC